jgi:uncharacterized protein YbaA (DUF1428 family)
MTYVDGFILAVPNKNLAAYKKLAEKAGKIWTEHGALEYRECVAEDLGANMGTPFRDAVLAKKTDTVVFSWIIYKDRAHRDAVNAKVMADPRMAETMNDPKSLPFDVKRMSYAGFDMIVDLAAAVSRTAKKSAAKKAVAPKAPAKKKAAAKRA